MTIYKAKPEDEEEWGHVGQVTVIEDDGTETPLDPQYEHVNHSPDGFGWGYHGSGAAQLAFAILFHVTGDLGYTIGQYQKFKADVVAKLPRAPWELTKAEIQEWAQTA